MKDGCDDHVTCVSAGVRVSCGRSRIEAMGARPPPSQQVLIQPLKPQECPPHPSSHTDRGAPIVLSAAGPIRGAGRRHGLLAPGRPLSLPTGSLNWEWRQAIAGEGRVKTLGLDRLEQ